MARKQTPRRRTTPKKKIVYIKPRLPLNGVQNTEMVKLRYCEQVHVNGGSGAYVYNFRANSLYDPNYTSVSNHQPMGFDQLATKYNHYQVLGSRIKITSVSAGTTAGSGDAPSWCTVRLTDNATSDYSNFTSVLESQPYGRVKKMYVSAYAPWNQSPDKMDQKVLSAYYDPKKMFGLTKATLNAEEDLKPLVTSNPNEDAIFQILIFPVATNGTRDAIDLLVEMDFTAKFSEPKSLPSS